MSSNRFVAITKFQNENVLKSVFDDVAHGMKLIVRYTPQERHQTRQNQPADWKLALLKANAKTITDNVPRIGQLQSLDDFEITQRVRKFARLNKIATVEQLTEIGEKEMASMPGFSSKILTDWKSDLLRRRHYPGVLSHVELPFYPVGPTEMMRSDFAKLALEKKDLTIVAEEGDLLITMQLDMMR